MFPSPAVPATLALTPQTLTAGLPALTGAETRNPLLDAPVPDVVVLPLLCEVGAQLLLWPDALATLALAPQTFIDGFAAFTGAETRVPVPGLPEVVPVAPLLCVVGAQLLP